MNKNPGPGTFFQDNFDISAVNGVNLTVDVQAVGGSNSDPGAGAGPFWLALNSPLSVHGADLRADCLPALTLKRSDLTGIPQPPFNQKVFGYVMIGDDGHPLGGDGPVACFNNCGRYKFPVEQKPTCDLSDPICLGWNTFCAGDGSRYDKGGPPTCSSDADCATRPGGGEVHAACWDLHLTGQRPSNSIDHTCQLRGFLSGSNRTTCNRENCTSPCPPDVCTFQYGFDNPITHRKDSSTQPPYGTCSDVFPVDTDSHCIGEDRIHKVFPHAYTWPNDPQVYASDTPLYRIIAAPGGTSVPITPAQNSLPACAHLPKIYGYNEQTLVNCSVPIAAGAKYAIADPSGSGQLWGCDLGAGDEGVICKWNPSKTNPPGVFVGDPHQPDCVQKSEQALIARYTSLRDAAHQYGFPPGFVTEDNLKNAITSYCGGPQ
jgi:hypothetical protein